jgi:hypothetical protein
MNEMNIIFLPAKLFAIVRLWRTAKPMAKSFSGDGFYTRSTR